MDSPSPISGDGSTPMVRRRFYAALALFLVWAGFLFTLGVISATGPRRSGSSVEIDAESPNP